VQSVAGDKGNKEAKEVGRREREKKALRLEREIEDDVRSKRRHKRSYKQNSYSSSRQVGKRLISIQKPVVTPEKVVAPIANVPEVSACKEVLPEKPMTVT
jgi:hypothetical protein